MKHTSHVNRWLFTAAIGLGVHLSACTLLAQTIRPYTNIVISSFDDALSPSIISGVGGNLGSSTIYDWSSENAGGGPTGSGSLYCSIPYAATGGGWQEVQLNIGDPAGGWPGRPMAPYYTIEYDIKVLSGDLGTDGSYGDVQIVFQGWDGAGLNSGDNWDTLGLKELTSTEWQHFTHVLTSVEHMNLNQIVINFVGQNVTNTCEYLIDNIEIKLPTGPPPTLALDAPPVSGLHLVMGSGYARQNIRTVNTNYAWVGASGPVSYSFTIKQYPDSAVYSNFQTHIFLVPNETTSPPNSDPDWTEPNVVRVDVESVNGTTNNPSALATMVFRYKTNAPTSNGIFYDAGELAALESTQILGTWTVTFNSDTDVTLSAPDGTSTNFAFADAPAWFPSDSLRVFYGIQAPSDASQEGQEAILSGAEITGAGGGLSDDFLGASLDTTKWQIAANPAANVFQVPGSSTAFELTWMLPDNLFKLYSATDLVADYPWQEAGLPLSVASGMRGAVVPQGVPGPEQGYFALVNRTPTKLQVLLPGETAAPGTGTGKMGTPDAQTAGVPFEIVVNAVDDNWYPAFLSDEMFVGSSAGTNGFGYVWAEELLHGTYTYTVTNLTAGEWTIQVIDVSDTNIAEVLSSPYTVNP